MPWLGISHVVVCRDPVIPVIHNGWFLMTDNPRVAWVSPRPNYLVLVILLLVRTIGYNLLESNLLQLVFIQVTRIYFVASRAGYFAGGLVLYS